LDIALNLFVMTITDLPEPMSEMHKISSIDVYSLFWMRFVMHNCMSVKKIILIIFDYHVHDVIQ